MRRRVLARVVLEVSARRRLVDVGEASVGRRHVDVAGPVCATAGVENYFQGSFSLDFPKELL